MKNIIIFYATYGGGHLSAAKSIKEYIDENYGTEYKTYLIDCIDYINHAINKLTTKAYADAAKKAPKLWGKVYSHSEHGPLASISNNSNKLMAHKLNKLITEINPSIIISAHPFSSQMCAYLKKKNKISVPVSTIMTDFAPHDQWLVLHEYINNYFVSNENMKDSLIEKGINSNKIFVTGIPLSSRFLKKYNKEEIINMFNLSNNKKTILFFAGGQFGLGKKSTYQMLEILAKNYIDIQIIAISGKNKKMTEKFEEIVQEYNREKDIIVLEFTDKVPELMSISDLVITKPGGLTTTESLASELPIIVINPIPGQEEQNAEFLEKNGLAVWIKDNDNIEEIFNSLFNHPEKLEQMRNQTKLFAKKHSTKDICEIILK